LYAHIERLLKSERPDITALERAFSFLELLMSHSDAKVRDVADQSVCENIACDEVVLQKAQRYVGEATKKACAEYIGK